MKVSILTVPRRDRILDQEEKLFSLGVFAVV